jgi:hypothetical protein
MSRWIEVLEGDRNRLSMSRLLCFISIFPASYVLVVTQDSIIFGWYVSAYVVGFVGGKGADALNTLARGKNVVGNNKRL